MLTFLREVFTLAITLLPILMPHLMATLDMRPLIKPPAVVVGKVVGGEVSQLPRPGLSRGP